MYHNVPRLFNLRELLSKSPRHTGPVTQWSLHPLWNAFSSCLPGHHTHLFAFYLMSHFSVYFILSFSPLSPPNFGWPQYSVPRTLLCHFLWWPHWDFYRTCFLFRVLKFTSPVKMIFPNSGLIYLTTYLISPPLAFSTCHLRHMLQSGTLPSSTNLFLPQFFHFPWKALSNYSGQAGKKSKNLWNHPGLFSFIQNSQQQISKCKSSLLFPSTPFCFHYSSPHLFSSYSILF